MTVGITDVEIIVQTHDIFWNNWLIKALVTGAAGFIGLYLSKALIENGWEVLGIDNLNDYYNVELKNHRLGILNEHNKSQNFEFIKLDLKDLKGINEKNPPYHHR